MKPIHLLFIAGIVLSPLPSLAAKEVSQPLNGNSIVYINNTDSADTIISSNTSGATSIYSSENPTTATIWSLDDTIDVADYSEYYTNYMQDKAGLDLVLVAQSGAAVKYKNAHYFVVIPELQSQHDVTIDLAEVWALYDGQALPEPVLSVQIENSAYPTITTVVKMNDALYFLDPNGYMWKGTGGGNWTKLDYVQPVDETNAWDITVSNNTMYLATDKGVYSSSNGQNWDELSMNKVCDENHCRILKLAGVNNDLYAVYETFVDGPQELWKLDSNETWTKVLKSKYGFQAIGESKGTIYAAKSGYRFTTSARIVKARENGHFHAVGKAKGRVESIFEVDDRTMIGASKTANAESFLLRVK